MAPPKRPWFRFYVEAPTDMKIRRLDPKHRWLWVCVLGAARQSHEPGTLMLTESLAWGDSDLSDYAGLPIREVRAGISMLLDLGMLTKSGDVLKVANWDERQYEGDYARSTVPKSIIASVMKRDGSCVGCGSQEELQIDHIVPVTKGGGNEISNLQVLCGACNRRKGNRERQKRYRDNARNGNVTVHLVAE